MDKTTRAQRSAWVGKQSVLLRVLLLALSPWRVVDELMGAVVGAPCVALIFAGLIRWLHWPEAALPIAILSAVLLLWAAVRLQREVDDRKDQREIAWRLGLEIDMGNHLYDDIRWESETFTALLEQRRQGKSVEIDLDQFHKSANAVAEWSQRVRGYLLEKCPEGTAAMFTNPSGLVSRQPPLNLDPTWIDHWQELDAKLQRLHEILKNVQPW